MPVQNAVNYIAHQNTPSSLYKTWVILALVAEMGGFYVNPRGQICCSEWQQFRHVTPPGHENLAKLIPDESRQIADAYNSAISPRTTTTTARSFPNGHMLEPRCYLHGRLLLLLLPQMAPSQWAISGSPLSYPCHDNTRHASGLSDSSDWALAVSGPI